MDPKAGLDDVERRKILPLLWPFYRLVSVHRGGK
jgi:hypothetical protein